MKQYKHYFFGGIIFVSTVICGFVTFAAWTNISTRTNGTTIDYTIWNELVNNINTIWAKVDTMWWSVPSGAIMPFYLTTCPSWWLPADGSSGTPDLRGQFLRGMNTFNSGTTYRTDGRQDLSNRSLWDWQWDDFKQHNHTYAQPYGCYDGVDSTTVNSWDTCFTTGNTWNAWWVAETRPKNIAVLYCIKS